MKVWSAEIKELTALYESLKGKLPDLEKELEKLVKADDENMVLLYSRRCLEVIVSDLCECELKRQRKTEPLKGVIDKLNKEEKVPSHIITSMLNLNSLSTYGAHPKEFNPRQARTVLIDLHTVIEWYLKYKNIEPGSAEKVKEEQQEIKRLDNLTEHIRKPKKKLIIIASGVFLIIAIVVFNIVSRKKQEQILIKTEKTIAVLPFRNFTNDSTQIYFCDGFMEEILNHLQKVKAFSVRSRTSSDQYRNTEKTSTIIGEELNVNYLVEGSVGREANEIKIWVQLIDAKTDEHIWSGDYIREIIQIFTIQSEIAKQIAHELKTVLSPEEVERIEDEPTENIEAYNLYLQGRYFWNKRTEKGIKEAIEYFSDAIEKDTNYALAYAGLADAYITLAIWGYLPQQEAYLKAKEIALEALEIDKTLAEAYASLAFVKLYHEWDWNGAIKDFERAIQLNPDYGTAHQWYSICLTIFRQHDEAIAEVKRAQELDPFSPIINRAVGNRLYFARKYDQAIEESLKALNITPDFYPTHETLGLAYLQKGMFSEAILEMQKAVRYSGDNLIVKALLGYVYGATGNNAKAQVIHSGLIETSKEGYVPSIAFAWIYIGLGDNDNAISWLEKAYEEHSSSLIDLNTDPIYDPLRSDTRFIELVKKMSFE